MSIVQGAIALVGSCPIGTCTLCKEPPHLHHQHYHSKPLILNCSHTMESSSLTPSVQHHLTCE